MADRAQLKTQGLALGRSLQMTLKTAIMYSVDHPAVERVLQEAYNSLNKLVRQTREFTLGFMNNRVLLNNFLVEDDALAQLEAEFAKRSIAGVTFEAGISLRDFRRGVALLATKPKTIEEKGGIRAFLEKNTVVGMRITPAVKADAVGTLVAMDPTSFLMAEGLLDSDSRTGMRNVDQLLQLARLDEPATAVHSPDEVSAMAGRATQEALGNPDADMRVPMAALGRLLERLQPDYLLAALPTERQSALRGRPANEVTTDLVEDRAARWAASRLAVAPPGAEAEMAEEEVVDALGRCLKATVVAERLVQKLARFIEEAHLPAEVTERVRKSLEWFTMSQKDRQAALLEMRGFDAQSFRHLLNHVQDLMNDGKAGEATVVVGHYFTTLEAAAPEAQAEGYARAPELLVRVSGLQTVEFLHGLMRPLMERLLDQKQFGHVHQPLSACLCAATQSLAPYEDFDFIREVGLALEQSASRDPASHAECCARALESLLLPASVSRLVELCIQRHEEADWVRAAVWLLKQVGPVGVEGVFQALEEETNAASRMRLLRLLEQLGESAIEGARKRLTDDRWYVVRNACTVLGALRDPELCSQLQGALRHADGRVQKHAVTTILKSQAPDRARALAEALPFLQADVLEMTLDELVLLRDHGAIEGLQAFVEQKSAKAAHREAAVRVLAAVPSELALQALSGILFNRWQDISVRRAALTALGRHTMPRARQLLVEFSAVSTDDPLAAECQKILGPASGS
jgi:hypothetical protein